MFMKYVLILFILLICFNDVVKARFVETDFLYSPIMKRIKNWSDDNTIIFIDLDDNLVTPKSMMFLYKSNPYRYFIDNMVSIAQRNDIYNNIIAKWYQQRKLKLVDNRWTEYIQELRDKGARIYGICKMPIHLINIEKKRNLELKELNITFTDKVNNQERVDIEKEHNWFSFFYKGVIYTGPYTKQHTIMKFIETTNIAFKKIVFISNIRRELEGLEKKLKQFDIDYYNILYLGVKKIEGELDKNMIRFQQHQLIHSGRWLEDDVARSELDKISDIEKKD